MSYPHHTVYFCPQESMKDWLFAPGQAGTDGIGAFVHVEVGLAVVDEDVVWKSKLAKRMWHFRTSSYRRCSSGRCTRRRACRGSRRGRCRSSWSRIRRNRGQWLGRIHTSYPKGSVDRYAAVRNAGAGLHETSARGRIRVLSATVVVCKAITTSKRITLGHARLHGTIVGAGKCLRRCRAVVAAVNLPDVVGGVHKSRLIPVGAL